MALVNVDIANKALTLCSANKINSFEQLNRVESIVANEIYEDVVQNAFTYPWRFATTKKQLQRKVEAPLSDWDAAYEMPGQPSVMNIEVVKANEARIAYDQIEDEIHCNASESDTVVMTYQYRVAEDEWPPYFRLYVIYKLASIFAGVITRKDDMTVFWGNEAEKQYIIAKQRDGVGVTPKRADVRRLVRTRRNSSWPQGAGPESV